MVEPAALADPLLLSLLGGGFAAAFLHAALPTHWLPFVLVGRAQGWTVRGVLAATGAAALAHILTTSLAGGLLLAVGLVVETWVAGLLPLAAAVLLLAIGGWYLLRALFRQPVMAGVGADAVQAPRARTDRAAFLALVGMLAVSPGEALLPFYLSGAPWGWTGLALLSGVFLVGTLAGMVLFTTLAWRGAAAFRLQRLARYEGAILGLALIALGVFVVLNPA